jgi:hypothetical protein
VGGGWFGIGDYNNHPFTAALVAPMKRKRSLEKQLSLRAWKAHRLALKLQRKERSKQCHSSDI